MYRRTFLEGIAAGTLLLAAAGNARASDASPKGRPRIDEFGEALVRSRRSAGYALGITRDGQMVHGAGYGYADLEQRTRVTEQTVFRIGSITKQFTAALIVLLADRGKLSLEDKLAAHVPEFPRAADVTIEQLLTHTSGIQNFTDRASFEADARLDYTSDALIAHIAGHSPLYDFEPGTAFAYSNSGFALLGVIAERVSGLSLGALLEREIFSKIGLGDTALDDDRTLVEGRAAGYERRPDRQSGFCKATYMSMTYAAGAGAMRSTIGDLAKWHRALLAGEVIEQQSLERMLAPGRLKNGKLASTALHRPRPPLSQFGYTSLDYGYGLWVGQRGGRTRIYHSGGMSGVKAYVETTPQQGITIVQLSNTTDGLESGASAKLAELLG